MTKDRELLELAAKAVGLVIVDKELRGFDRFLVQRMSDGLFSRWNPLTDDGDRYRLAKALSMTIEFHTRAVGAKMPDGKWMWMAWGSSNSHKHKTDADAIVALAAEIGGQMP